MTRRFADVKRFHRGAIQGKVPDRFLLSHRFAGKPSFFPAMPEVCVNQPIELTTAGLKHTLPRIRVLDVFRQSTTRHLSAEDVYRELLMHSSDVGLATVYRVLSQFEQAGILRRSQLGSNKSVYELNDGDMHHGHLVSLRDGSVMEFSDPEIEARLREAAKARGMEMAEFTITVFAQPTNQ